MEALKLKMTVDEFLVWAEGRDGRYELHDGEVIKMPAEQRAHRRVKSRIFLALRAAVAGADVPCHVEPDGATVRISPRAAYEPDALVYCGPEVDDKSYEITNPLIIVEVLSPSNSATDTKLKLPGYFSLPSVQHYLIADPDKNVLTHYTRSSGEPVKSIHKSGNLTLTPPGILLNIDDVFAYER